MAIPPALDLDLLRTLVLIAQERSFTRAAERIGRTQSAVSLQMQRLETLIGQPVLVRAKGGTIELTPAGKLLLDRSRDLLALNDEILSELRKPASAGEVRLGAPEDFSRRYLPMVLAGFARSHPGVSVEISQGPSCQHVPMLTDGALDLMICEGGIEPRRWPAVELHRASLRWITSRQHDVHRQDPVPLVLSPGNCPFRPAWLSECIWRGAAIHAMEKAGRRYRVVSTSSTQAGQQAAALAGLGLTVSTTIDLPEGLRALEPKEGFPPLPDTGMLLLKATDARQPVTDALAAEIIGAFDRHEGPAGAEPAGNRRNPG
jgi:DNA-binding transcriptional LysR family regulator